MKPNMDKILEKFNLDKSVFIFNMEDAFTHKQPEEYIITSLKKEKVGVFLVYVEAVKKEDSSVVFDFCIAENGNASKYHFIIDSDLDYVLSARIKYVESEIKKQNKFLESLRSI